MGHLGISPVCPLLLMVHWDAHSTAGWDGHLRMGVLYTGHFWDSPSVSNTSFCTAGWDGHLGLGVLYMGHLGIPPVCPPLSMVQWDWMDAWDWECCTWDTVGFPQCVHYFPQYTGMGWTPGIGSIVHGTSWDTLVMGKVSHLP